MAIRKGILADHKRRGKTLVPPFVHLLAPLHEISWIRTILPELLWIALIQNLHGHRRGVELITGFSRSVRNIAAKSSSNLFASVSSYSGLSISEQESLRLEMANAKLLIPIQDALEPLVGWYPDCPLAFLFAEKRRVVGSSEGLLNVKNIVSSMYNRSDRGSVMVQATAVWLAFDAEILKVSAGLSLARFPEIEHYPATELSRQIGSSIRSTVNMIFGSEIHYSGKYPWPGYFWNRGLAIEPCEFINE